VERAREFYEQVFGWGFKRWGDNPYWVVLTGEDGTPGINGGLLPRQGDAPELGAAVNAFVVTVEVGDLDATVEKALKLGGELRLPKMHMEGIGWVAYLADPEGNLLGALEPETPAEG
jgi:predicted enzyme related to lactoylglutathione lyase